MFGLGGGGGARSLSFAENCVRVCVPVGCVWDKRYMDSKECGIPHYTTNRSEYLPRMLCFSWMQMPWVEADSGTWRAPWVN